MSTIEKIIYPILNDMKEDLDLEFENSPELMLFGKNAALDSLALVSMIVELEDKIMDECGVEISIANEDSMSAVNSPFKTVRTLADYIDTLITKAIK